MRKGYGACAVIDRRKFLRSVAGLGLVLSSSIEAQPADVFTRVGGRVPAPDFSLADVDGKPWRFSALQGQVVVVNFWATWCPPCRRELPSLEVLHKATAVKGVLVLGINAGETWDQVAAFTADFKPPVTFPLLMDKDGAVVRDWQVRALPTTYVVNREGRIVLRALGGRDFSRPDALADVTALANDR
jgi:thiol-disulfide isomerase/thioredoxin